MNHMKKFATISKCGAYRYWLERRWEECGKDYLNFIMLNPSTADSEKDDATIRRCVGLAKQWGFGGIHVVNLFALRSTNPDALYSHPDPVGPENDTFIEAGLVSAPLTIVAWGTHGKTHGRDDKVMRMLNGYKVQALGINKDGSFRHPLYVPGNVVPVGVCTTDPTFAGREKGRNEQAICGTHIGSGSAEQERD